MAFNIMAKAAVKTCLFSSVPIDASPPISEKQE